MSVDLRDWQTRGFYPKVSVNLHPDTLSDAAYIAQIAHLLPPEQVQLEFLERAYIDDNKQVRQNIALLRARGFKLAIDDFGSGYSCLDTLYNIPVDCIKFDKKLIDHIDTSKGLNIYTSIASMCKSLGFTTVAEGVETEAQVQVAKAAGVDFIQGWYYARAMPFDEVQAYVATFNAPPKDTPTH